MIGIPVPIFLTLFLVAVIFLIFFNIAAYKLTRHLKQYYPLEFEEKNVFEYGKRSLKNALRRKYFPLLILFAPHKLFLDEFSTRYTKRARKLLVCMLITLFSLAGYVLYAYSNSPDAWKTCKERGGIKSGTRCFTGYDQNQLDLYYGHDSSPQEQTNNQ